MALKTLRLARNASCSLGATVLALAKFEATVFMRVVWAFRAEPAMPKMLSSPMLTLLAGLCECR